MQSGVAQRSVLGPVLFNIFIKDACDVINHSNCLLFVSDLKVYRTIRSPSDCLLLQSDIDRVHNWCSAKFMEPNFSKIGVISFTRRKNVLNYQYKLGNSFILRTDCIKDLDVHIDCKLQFHRHVDFLFPHAMKLFGLIRKIAFSFFTTDSPLMLYFALVRSKLEYALLLGTLLRLRTPINFERVQRFPALSHSRFLQDVEHHYDNLLEIC
jgi:hypothetical protein